MAHRKLSDFQVEQIRRRLDTGESQRQLALIFEVSHFTIRQIANGNLYVRPSTDAKRTGHVAPPKFSLPPLPSRPLGYDPNQGRSYPFPKKERFA